jgi:uroporphyrinogen-III synthase
VLPEAELARARSADAITFTSSSTVSNFVAGAGLDALPGAVVAIGPVTAETAEELGVAVTAVAEPHTIDGLVAAVVATLTA